MADNERSTTMSPKAAFASIWDRIRNAVKEGKEKAGVFESIMEASNNGGLGMIDLGEESLFDDPDENNEANQIDINSAGNDKPASIDLGEEAVIDDEDSGEQQSQSPSETSSEAPARKRVLTGTIGGAPQPAPEQPVAIKRPKRLTKAERDEEERRLRERKRQIDAENNYSVAEISEQWKSLFAFADQNKEYLKDAGKLITEEELRSLFAAEYRNYTGREHGDATDVAVSAAQDLFKEKISWILDRIDARLHGNGDFMMGGSLMKYLFRAATLKKSGRTIILQDTANLGIKSHTVAGDKTNVLSQFILTSDLDDCKDWIRNRFKDYNVPEDAVKALALDILAKGANNEEVIAKLGGKQNIPHSLYNPKFGSIESAGDDAVIIGRIDFLGKLNELIDQHLGDTDANIGQVGLKIEPCEQVLKNKTHGGVKCIRMDAKKLVPIINTLKSQNEIIPIALGVGMVATDSMGGGDKNGSSAAEGLLSHRTDAGMAEFSSAFGERKAANGLMQVLNTQGAREIARMANAEKELADALAAHGEVGKLSAFATSVLKWACDAIGEKCSVSTTKGVSVLKPESANSIASRLRKVADLGNGKHAVVFAAMLFNNAMQNRFGKKTSGGDIGDIPSMSANDIRKEAMPILQLGDVAEKCYVTLGKKYGEGAKDNGANDVLSVFGKGYLVYRMGALFGIETRDLPLISNARAFRQYVLGGANAPNMMNVSQINYALSNMGAIDLVGMAYRLDSAAAGMDTGNQEIETPEFYVNDGIRLDNIEESGLIQSIAYISSMNPMECICTAVEELSGMPTGTVTKYYSDLEKCVDKNAIVQGARFIKENGDGLIDISMTDAGKEKIKQVAPAAAPAPTNQVRPGVRVAPRRVGRGRF